MGVHRVGVGLDDGRWFDDFLVSGGCVCASSAKRRCHSRQVMLSRLKNSPKLASDRFRNRLSGHSSALGGGEG
jgi:hypothetical protein